ncbi:hypothetical protein ACFCX2_43085, partial [Streptomyces sp. NPDC056290]
MTHTPNSAAPPGTAAPGLPAVPAQRATAPAPAPAPSGPASPTPPAARRTAFAEGADRLRRAATTEPGRLRIIGAVLAA